MDIMRAARNAATTAKGKLKTAVGKATGNTPLAARGRGEQASVRMKEAAHGALDAARRSAAHLQRGHANTISPTTRAKRSRH